MIHNGGTGAHLALAVVEHDLNGVLAAKELSNDAGGLHVLAGLEHDQNNVGNIANGLPGSGTGDGERADLIQEGFALGAGLHEGSGLRFQIPEEREVPGSKQIAHFLEAQADGRLTGGVQLLNFGESLQVGVAVQDNLAVRIDEFTAPCPHPGEDVVAFGNFQTGVDQTETVDLVAVLVIAQRGDLGGSLQQLIKGGGDTHTGLLEQGLIVEHGVGLAEVRQRDQRAVSGGIAAQGSLAVVGQSLFADVGLDVRQTIQLHQLGQPLSLDHGHVGGVPGGSLKQQGAQRIGIGIAYRVDCDGVAILLVEFFINRGIAVRPAGVHVGPAVKINGNLFSGSGGGVSGRRFCLRISRSVLRAAGRHGQNHHDNEQQSEHFLHFCFLLFSDMSICANYRRTLNSILV